MVSERRGHPLHTTQPAATTRPSLGQVAHSIGFRHVQLVRVTVGPTRTTASATGVLHRYPLTVAISLATAGMLVAAGVPVRVDHRSGSLG